MRSVRVIPCLDVDAGRVVKGVNFVNLRDAGDPVELAARYDAEGADEVVFLDITASSSARDTIVDVASRTAEQCFIPFTVGGGIRGQAAHLLHRGFSERHHAWYGSRRHAGSRAAAWTARTMPWYPVQRHRLPEIPMRTSHSVGLGLSRRNSSSVVSMPGVQKPHCNP